MTAGNSNAFNPRTLSNYPPQLPASLHTTTIKPRSQGLPSVLCPEPQPLKMTNQQEANIFLVAVTLLPPASSEPSNIKTVKTNRKPTNLIRPRGSEHIRRRDA
jgi:hypothetical protein